MAPTAISVAVWHPLDRVDLRVQLASHLRGRMASAVVRYGTAKTTQKELRAIKVRYGMITIMQNTFRTTTVWYGTRQRPFLRFCTVPQTDGARRNRGIPTFFQPTPVRGTVRNTQTPANGTPYHNGTVRNAAKAVFGLGSMPARCRGGQTPADAAVTPVRRQLMRQSLASQTPADAAAVIRRSDASWCGATGWGRVRRWHGDAPRNHTPCCDPTHTAHSADCRGRCPPSACPS